MVLEACLVIHLLLPSLRVSKKSAFIHSLHLHPTTDVFITSRYAHSTCVMLQVHDSWVVASILQYCVQPSLISYL